MLRHSAGFTLLEVMIAMTILAIGLSAVFQLKSQSISMASESRFLTTASFLAQMKMSDIEAAASVQTQTQTGDFTPDFPEYGWSLTVTDTQIGRLKRIELSVFNKVYPGGGAYQLIFYKMSGM